LEVDAYAGDVHLLVFMFINGLRVHVSLFEEFQTYKFKTKISLSYVLCYCDIRANGTMQHVRSRMMYSIGYARWHQRTLWNYTLVEKFRNYMEVCNSYDGTEQLG